MARLGDLNPQATHFTNTMCPGTDVYMPPEAVQDKPVYTEKIDCFSFGVIAVQTLTREFPKPGERLIAVNVPRYPRPLKMDVPEIERRQNHISRVDPNHPLLPIALDCLKDADGERPSAQQLCERVAALKETAKYKNASERVKDSRGKEGEYEQLQHVIDQKEQQLRQYRDELTQQRQQLEREKRQIEQERDRTVQEKNQENQQQSQQIQKLEREKQQAIQEKVEKERHLGRVNQQLEESERLIADFGKRNIELEEEVKVLRNQVQGKDGGAKAGAVSRTDFKLRWREGEKAPCAMSRYCDAAVHVYNRTVYCKYDSNDKVYAYHISSSSWSLTPNSPSHDNDFALVVIDGLLTTVGGYGDDNKNTNKLLSLTGEDSGRRWTEKFPSMPTKCFTVSALCTGAALIVAGGRGGDKDEALKTVEVLNTETREWHTAADLPQPLALSSMTLCGDLVYLLGGVDKDEEFTKLVYSCSLTSLLFSTGSKSLGKRLINTLAWSRKGSPWNRVADLPVIRSTAVSLHGRLLAIGGDDSENKPTTAVHMYQPTTNSWEVISHMTTPRSRCLSAVLPDNQLMVVGGFTTGDEICDSIEFGTVF
jgi:hypothetical protein